MGRTLLSPLLTLLLILFYRTQSKSKAAGKSVRPTLRLFSGVADTVNVTAPALAPRVVHPGPSLFPGPALRSPSDSHQGRERLRR